MTEYRIQRSEIRGQTAEEKRKRLGRCEVGKLRNN